MSPGLMSFLKCHQVVITSWQPELPTFSDLEQRRSDLWQRPAWARGVLVDDRAAAKGGPPLHVKMQHVSACPSVTLEQYGVPLLSATAYVQEASSC